MEQRRHYFILDGVRGLAAVLVVFRHTEAMWTFTVFRSYLAVDIFFLLSGFVVTAAYQSRLEPPAGAEAGKLSKPAMSFASFARTRLLRLWPMYAAGIVLGAVAANMSPVAQVDLPYAGARGIPAFLVQLMFLPYYRRQAHLYPFDPVAWSLLAELVANFLFAALVLKFRSPWKPWLALVAALCFLALAFKSTFAGEDNWAASNIVMATARSCFGFSVGSLLYDYRTEIGKRLESMPRFMLAFAGFLLAFFPLLLPSIGPRDGLVDFACCMTVIPAGIALLTHVSPPKSKLLFWLGAISYPFYTLQLPVDGIAEKLGYVRLLAQNVSGAIFIAGLVVLCLLLLKLFDEPLRARLKGWAAA